MVKSTIIKCTSGLIGLGCLIYALVTIIAILGMAGGISRDAVAIELSQYVSISDASLIVEADSRVSSKLLVSISEKRLSSDAMTVLLLHPQFPQGRRSALISAGKDGFYVDNACLRDELTDEDVRAWVGRTSVSESMLEYALKECDRLSSESKDIIRQRIRTTFSYRLRRLLDFGFDKKFK